MFLLSIVQGRLIHFYNIYLYIYKQDGTNSAINLLLTISHHQFGLRLVTIVLLRLVTIGDELPWLICHQPMVIILINMYFSKKENVFFHIYGHA